MTKIAKLTSNPKLDVLTKKNKITNITKFFTVFFFLMLGFFYGSAQEVVPFSPRLDGDNIEIRGDIIFVGNNILNRATESNPAQANTAYNGSDNNNSLWMEYIDIDSDASTFSSSSAELNISDPSCSQVRYAGLYWAGTYPNERSTDGGAQFNGTPRVETWNEIKFKVPGGAYVDLIADDDPDAPGEEDDIIFDGIDPSDGDFFKDAPVICYKEITDLVRSNSNPNGEYTAANIRATRGRRNGSSSAGWVMVVIYENPNESGKFISTFDGYAGLSGSVGNVDIAVNGFKTLPSPFPVRARIGVGALEGDRNIRNDRFFISANSVTGFTNMTTGLNPANNFFNSTITVDGVEVPTRTPYGTNTLGTDIDLFNLNNPSETVLPNDETGAVLRFTSTGDGYGPFITSFSVEIIEPNIVLEKRVENIAGDDITGSGVNLGQTLDYVLSFRNLGNDDAVNYSIRDLLPVNTEFVSVDYPSGDQGVTYSFDATANEITFDIPDDIIKIGDPTFTIRLRVEVAENCFDFVDACTDLIENLAYSTYQGDINRAIISDDPSVSDFDNCGFVTPGATNFLLDDLSSCNFSRTTQLCGDFVILDSGDGFDNYVWYLDVNEDGQIDGGDVDITGNDGNPDNDPSTIVVSEVGVYIVDKQIADPCKGFLEIITVERFGTTQTNPIVDFFNDSNSDADDTNDIQGEVVADCNDGTTLFPKIFLCGINDSQLLQVNISDAQGLFWEKLDETSCTVEPENCLNRNLTCTWNQVDTGSDFTANTEGKYRLSITYTNGCVSRFYFDVYQNNLDIEYTSRNVVCESDGNITITNLGTGYGYQLVDVINNTIPIPFSANNGSSFDFTTNGAYRVEVVQLDPVTGDPILGACIFSTPEIGILDQDLQVDLIPTDANCNTLGSVQINANNVLPNYSYELRLDDGTPALAVGDPNYYVGHPGGTLVDDETAQPSNTHTFNNINPEDYIIVTRTEDGCIDVQNITISRIPDPTLSGLTIANIGCTAGSIELTRTGGQGNPDFLYAIWSKDGTVLYHPGGSATEQDIVNNIDPNAYQVETTFTFGWRDEDDDGNDEYYAGEDGEYVFIVLDANGCYALSAPVQINDTGGISIVSIDEEQPSCSGDADGELTINISGGIGPYQYSIDNGATYQSTSTFVNLDAGTYSIRVLDDSGCDITSTYTLSEPFPLSASAGVSRDATCDPSGAEVRITNVVGGSGPGTYEYSFDGGSTWGTTSVATLPPGDYTLLVRDDNCSFPMDVTVEDLPDEPEVTLTPEVSYNCDGSAIVTATPNITTYDYEYSLNGTLNSPPESNVFTNVGPGTYTVSTTYISQTPPTPSILLTEDFGAGATIPSPNTTGYCFEPQDGTNICGSTNTRIQDLEYAVTSSIVRPYSVWNNPTDHTGLVEGRYLVINIGTPGAGQAIYRQEINDIVPNQDLEVSLWAMNLLVSTHTSQVDPDLTIELREVGSGNLVASAVTGAIARNDLWNNFSIPLNPGSNTSLELFIITNESDDNGNDVAIDDITVLQTPEVCPLTVETPVTVTAGQVFDSELDGSTNVSCNGVNDGTISFTVENFDATAGYDYSLDSGFATFTNTTIASTTVTGLGAGTQTVYIRKANETTCIIDISADITQPDLLVPTAAITTGLTCTNGATITANASGGTPTYDYQLEDNGGTVIGTFDFATNGSNRTFANLAAGTYVVRVQDNNSCSEETAQIVVDPMNTVVFNAAAITACYAGGNTAGIQVDVTDGNGGYQFRINAGPWLTPTPTSATIYTFNGLSSGPYDIDVRDQNGCPLTLATQTVVINPQLTLSATAPVISICDTDGLTDMDITANGGDTNYVYSVVPSGNTPTDASFLATNPVTGFGPGNYDVYVRDNNGDTVAGYCEASFPITITQETALNFIATPTDVSCNGGTDGAIAITAPVGGNVPYRYSVDGGATYVTGANFPNLSAGDYDVRIQDANLCESAIQTITIDEPDELLASAAQTQDYTCAQLGEITVTPTSGGSGNYQYSINGSAWTASTTGAFTFNGLDDDTYVVRVRDANATNCFITLADVVINPLPVAPTVDYTVAYNCDGTGTVTVTPFDTDYIYILNSVSQTGATGNVFNNIAVGTYDLRVTYSPDCHVDTSVTIQDGNAFEASITAFENLDCNADGSGSITIDAENYGAGGYEYSLNSGTFVGPFTAPETISGLNAQAHNIVVRDVDNPIAGCTVPLSQTLTDPIALDASASITAEFTCSNTGATITANVTGGTTAYQYQLEISDDADLTAPYASITSVVTTYQNSPVFNNVPANNPGESYVVRVRDNNNCEDVIDTAIEVEAPNNPTFTTTPTACYSGSNDGSIQVDVTSIPGNGGFQFRLDGGPWRIPTPATATTYTFENLSNGTYNVDVRDGFGCTTSETGILIQPQLIVGIDVDDLSACADGSITANATGGNGTLVYAIVPANSDPTGLFTTTNTLSITSAMATADPAWDVYVQDNNGVSPICTFLEEDIIFTPVTTLSVTATPTDPECYDGLGDIDASVTGGTAPFTYTLTDLSTADGIDYGRTNTNISTATLSFNGVGVGNYEVTITDANGCSTSSSTVTIDNAVEITTNLIPILPANCDDPSNTPADYGFEFDTIVTPVSGGSEVVEYSADGGSTWQSSDELRGYLSGTEVFPSIRVTLGSGTICQKDFDRYIIEYPLDDLNITINPIIYNCNDLQVTVQGSAGDGLSKGGYRYTYTDDPANFGTSTPVWTAYIASGTAHTFENIDPTTPQQPGLPLLVPGRTYVFYVQDGVDCIRQSSVNINDVVANIPIEIIADVKPTCDGVVNGEITFTLNPDTAYPRMRWEIYEVGNTTAIETSGGYVAYNNTVTTTIPLAEGDYYIDVIQADISDVDACRGASENTYVPELPPITGTATPVRDISCNLPGLIEVTGLNGGSGAPYTFDVAYTSGTGTFTTLTGLNSNPIQIPINSPAGGYTVTVNDQYGCPLVLSEVTLSLSPNPTIAVTQDNCAAPITVNVNATSAAGNIRYAMVTNGNPAPTTYEDNGGVFINVAPGSYDFYIIDGNGCTNVETAFIVNPVLNASATLTKLLDCTGTPDDAQITLEITEGSGDFTFEITNTTGGSVPTFTQNQTVIPSAFPFIFVYDAPEAADYTITVRDNSTPNTASCNREFTIPVAAELTPVLSIEPTSVANETCNSSDDGSFTVSAVDNGSGPFTFEITASTDGAVIVPINPTTASGFSATFTGLSGNLAAGTTYTVTATSDTNDCSSSIDQLITQPDAIVVPTANIEIDEFGCATGNNADNASITVNLAVTTPTVSNVTGGSGTYVRYQFFNNLDLVTPVQDGTSNTYIETNVLGGNYTVYVFDDNGCQGLTTATIAPYDELLTVDASHTVTCSATADGEVTIAATSTTNDATQYEYSIDNGATWQNTGNTTNPNIFSGLAIGTHNFLVRHTLTGCILPVSETITDPNTFEIDITNTTNVICDGSATGTMTFALSDAVGGYTGNYTWEIFDTNGTPGNPSDDGTAVDAGTSASLASNNLLAGEYRVSVSQDVAPGCAKDEFFTIGAPNGPIAGDTQVDPVTCAGNDGVIEVIDVQGGWGGYEYFVALASDPVPTASTTFVSDPRFTALSGASGPAGTDYQVWIRDSEGCMERLPDVNLVTPDPIAASLQINQANCTDFSGEIEVVGIPSTDPVSGGQGSNYRYQLQINNSGSFVDTQAEQSTAIFPDLGAGEYRVVVSDQWGCSGITVPVSLYDVIAPDADITKTIDCTGTPGGEITITQTGGSGTFDYEIRYPGTLASDPADATVTAASTAVFSGLTLVGDYVFTITDTATDHVCSTTITQRLEDAVVPNIVVNSFTNITCNGSDDGTISVSANPDNGIGPYTFTVISASSPITATLPIAATSSTTSTAVFEGLEGTVAGITYTIRVSAANGCTNDETQVISQPEDISGFTVDDVQFGCGTGNVANNASLTVDVSSISGGTGDYRFEFTNNTTSVTVDNGNNPTFIITDYTGATYTVAVFDENGCSETETATIDSFNEISDPVVTDLVDVTCNPGDDAQIEVGVTVNPVVATPNLTYTVDGINVTYSDSRTSTNHTETFTGLRAGNYAVTITNDDTGCVIETVHTVEEPEEMDIIATKVSDEECLNDAVDGGAFDFTVSPYTGTFNYQVYDIGGSAITAQSGAANSGSEPSIVNLPGGSYYVEITQTQAPFCVENSNVITILSPEAPITFTPREETSVSCSNDQGSILINPDGGKAPYTIGWTNTTTSQSDSQANVAAHIFSGLSAGDYIFTVTDTFGCTETENITLVRPDDIVAAITASTLFCSGDDTASVTASIGARNVTPVYSYQLNIYSDLAATTPSQTSVKQATDTFDDLTAGFYSTTVTDDTGCSDESNRIQIVDPTEVSAQLIRTSPLTCATGVEFELTASGGTGPYEYFNPITSTWIAMSGVNTEDFPNTDYPGPLAAGSYQFRVRDANQCESLLSNEITEDPIVPLSLEVDETAAVINCTGENTAIIYAEADGGLGNYQYELYTDASLSLASRIAGPQTLGEFRGLAAGIYYVNVTSGDCTVIPERVEIIEPAVLEYTEDIINVTCFGEENGTIAVTLSGGAGGYQYAISPNLDQFDTENTFTDLAPGDYVVIAQDQNGCFERLEYTITEPTILTVDATPLPEVCVGSADGSITLDITGGTAPYRTALDSNNPSDFIQDRLVFNGLTGGNYLVFVMDANDCERFVVVDIDPGVNLNATIEPIYECTGDTPDNYVNITLEDPSVLGDVLYALDSTDPADMQLNPDFRNTAPGMHYIAIAHSNGCVQTFDFEIEDFEPLILTLEQSNINEITAIAEGGKEGYTFYFGDRDNGDDNTFIINRTDTYVVTVVDENGCEAQANIFMEFIDIEIPNFFTPDGDGQNDVWIPRNMEAFPEILTIIFDRYGREVYRFGLNDEGWDGFYQQTELPTGDYWYVIKLNGEEDNREFIGHFTLYR